MTLRALDLIFEGLHPSKLRLIYTFSTLLRDNAVPIWWLNYVHFYVSFEESSLKEIGKIEAWLQVTAHKEYGLMS